MKNKESLLKWSNLLKILAKITLYLAIGIDVVILINTLETGHISGLRSIFEICGTLAVVLFIATALNEVLRSISEIIIAIIDLAENLQGASDRNKTRHFTNQ